MVVGGKLLALLLPFSLLLSLAYSATTTVTGTAATCFATLGSAAVGSTTFAVRGSGTRRYAAGGGSGGEAGSWFLVLDLLLLNRQDLLLGRLLHQQNRRNQPSLLSVMMLSSTSFSLG